MFTKAALRQAQDERSCEDYILAANVILAKARIQIACVGLATLAAGVAQSPVGGYAERHAIGERYFPVKGPIPASSKENVPLVQEGQDRPYHHRHDQ